MIEELRARMEAITSSFELMIFRQYGTKRDQFTAWLTSFRKAIKEPSQQNNEAADAALHSLTL